ncbi:regulator of nonsense transcripts 3A isoform X3 [Marmota flaviventris]|uniref:regulator of nonsense transcripts 3A isoform X3 n=1 Tax=Marmota flaviventris TaxID=93162 RepID=UPI000FFF70C7|nr:regulator of nonsense transcripts 3A isoform X3 [Marmota flaviventris]
MRSEKERAGGPGATVGTRGPGGREKLSAAEVQLRREAPRREPETPASSSGCGGGAGKPREEKRTALSKVVLRRLPPGLTKEQLEEQLHPLPAHDYFEVVAADLSLHPHLYSRAYINFRDPDDILLFRDRFDGYVFIGNKGLEYPAVVEFAPFQKIAKKKLKKKDTKTGSIADDPEYKQFLETYSVEEEKTSTNPEILLGERIREEKREERRRRELEKKRLREEEKRKRKEEETCKRKEAEKQKKTAEKEVKIQVLLKKPEKGEESTTEKPKERGEEAGVGDGRREAHAPCTVRKTRLLESLPEALREKSQDDSDGEQRDLERRPRGREAEMLRCHLDSSRKHGAHSEFARFARRNEDELRWVRGSTQDRGKKGRQDGGIPMETAERLAREKEDNGLAPRKERLGSKVL